MQKPPELLLTHNCSSCPTPKLFRMWNLNWKSFKRASLCVSAFLLFRMQQVESAYLSSMQGSKNFSCGFDRPPWWTKGDVWIPNGYVEKCSGDIYFPVRTLSVFHDMWLEIGRCSQVRNLSYCCCCYATVFYLIHLLREEVAALQKEIENIKNVISRNLVHFLIMAHSALISNTTLGSCSATAYFILFINECSWPHP